MHNTKFYNTSKVPLIIDLVYHCVSGGNTIEVYCDSDWAGDHADWKSTTRYVILLNGTVIICKSVKQLSITLSILEAEYLVLLTMTTEVLWLQTIL